jgi:plastocyanin
MRALRLRFRALYLPLAALLGAAVAVVPKMAAGDTPPATASFSAVDFAWNVTGGTATQATIAQGGTVTFSYPSGASTHNADFGSGPQPSSCTQTGGSITPVPPLPTVATGPGWSGTCTFNTPGTYTFHCDHHPTTMIATIIVQAPVTTTSSGTTSTGPTTGTGTTTGTSPTGMTPGGNSPPPGTPTTNPSGSGGSPLAGGQSKAIIVASTEHGTSVRGSAILSSAGADGRLEVDVFASRTALAAAAGAGSVRVGRLVRTSLSVGKVRFSVPLSASAKRALHRHKRLALTVKIIVVSSHGVRVSATRGVLLRP